MAIEEAFGSNYFVMYGSEFESEWRVLVTVTLAEGLRNPRRFVRAQAKKFAQTLTRIFVDAAKNPYDYYGDPDELMD